MGLFFGFGFLPAPQFAHTRSKFTWLLHLHVCCFCFFFLVLITALSALEKERGTGALKEDSGVRSVRPSLLPLIFLCQSKGKGGADDSLVVVLEVLHSRMLGPVFPAVPLQFGTF